MSEPLRRCTGCREMKPKTNLIRVVRKNKTMCSVDLTGKEEGRGAYLCCNTSCFAKAKKSRGLERSFKAPVPKEIYDELEQILAEK